MHMIEALANVHLPGGLMLRGGEEREVEEVTPSMEKAERLGLLRISRSPDTPTAAPKPAREWRGG